MINRIAAANPGGSQALLPDYSHPDASGFKTPGKSWSEQLSAQLEQCISEHPLMSLTVGLTIGIVVGCFIKRR